MKRKLAEIWEVDGDYQLRIEVGAFQRRLTNDSTIAEQVASFEVFEILRTILAEADANNLLYRADTQLEPD